MSDIMHLIGISAPVERVYRALTTAEGVRNWWTRDVALSSDPGGTGVFGFNGHRFVITVKVDDLTPPARVRWRAISGSPGWEGTTMSFDLRTEGGETILLFAHRGFERADEGYASATTRWGAYLISLKQYLESGRGAPNPDDIFAH